MQAATPATAPPRIDKIHAKIGALERRLMHLRQRLQDRKVSEAARSFDMGEAAALEDAVRALRWIAGIPSEGT